MRLASLVADGSERLALVTDERALAATELEPTAPATMGDLLADLPAGLAVLRRLAGDGGTIERVAAHGQPLDELGRAGRLLAPVSRPGKVIAVGRNYAEHASEQGVALAAQPILFAKLPSSVIGSGAEVRWDPALTTKVDLEVELAAIIGRQARRIGPAAALDHVLGYTVANDVTARDLQFGDGQWTRGKSLDTFGPMGPVLVTTDELPDPQALRLTAAVNGEPLQDGTTAAMHVSTAELIAFCSQAFTLEPGDVILTGTPAGAGHFRKPPRYLADGDELDLAIEGIGRLVNRCREERRA